MSLGGLLLRAYKRAPHGLRPYLEAAYLRALRLVYRGDAVRCPCCDGSFRDFARPPWSPWWGLCPGCGSLERHRLMWLYLQEKTDLATARLRVLHVAPEPFLAKKLAPARNLDYVSIDLDAEKAQTAMDLTDLRFDVASFDVILCSHVLEHIPDDQTAMRELNRVLKPGGWALLQSPIDRSREKTLDAPNVVDPAERARLFGQDDHVRLYGRDYVTRLESAGFHVSFEDYSGYVAAEQLPYYGLDPTDPLCIARKPASPAPDA